MYNNRKKWSKIINSILSDMIINSGIFSIFYWIFVFYLFYNGKTFLFYGNKDFAKLFIVSFHILHMKGLFDCKKKNDEQIKYPVTEVEWMEMDRMENLLHRMYSMWRRRVFHWRRKQMVNNFNIKMVFRMMAFPMLVFRYITC